MTTERRDGWSIEFRTAAVLVALVWGFGHSLDILFQLAAGLPALALLRADLPLMIGQYLLSLTLFPVVAASERLSPVLRWSMVALGVTAVAGAMVGMVLVNMIGHGQLPASTATDPDLLRRWLGRSMIVPIYVYICGFVAAVMIFARWSREMTDQRNRLLAAEAAAASARFLALRLQVNPHFLFNALNAISSLIVTREVDAAEEAVARLSEFLRVSLAADPTTCVSLEDELAATEAYLAIETVRFSDRLRVRVDCPPELLDAAVPSLILQPLAENAVKYGVSATSAVTTVTIAISATDDVLTLALSDDAAPIPGDRPAGGTGIGLDNIRQRLRLMYGEDGSLVAEPQAAGFRNEVRLPLSRMESSSR